MLEKITFKNHINETLEFGEGGLYLNINDLRSYKWAYDAKNNRVSYFRREIKERTLPIVVVPPNNRDEGNAIINRLMELAEKDVLEKKAGKIIAGDYYLNCFIFGNEKTKYDLQRGVFYVTLSVVPENGNEGWIKESTQSFDSTGTGSDFLDYAYDLPYDWTSPSKIRRLINTSFSSSDFKMTIYGEVTDPTIYINGHEYSVTGHVGTGEYLEINSRDKTITLVRNNGQRVNWFRYRNKEDYIFEKIPEGELPVAWQGEYVFDVTLYEERSEPKWT